MQIILNTLRLALWVLHHTQDFLYRASVFNQENQIIQGCSLEVLTVHPASLLTFDPGLCAEELDSV